MKAEFLSLFDIPVSGADFSDWFFGSVSRMVSFKTFNSKLSFVGGVCINNWRFRVVWLDDMLNVVGSSISGEELVQVSVSANIASRHLLDRRALHWSSSWGSVSLLTSHSRLFA